MKKDFYQGEGERIQNIFTKRKSIPRFINKCRGDLK